MASGTIYLTESSHTSGGAWIEGKVTWSSVKYTASNTSKVTAKIYVRKQPGSLTVATSGSWQYKLNIIVDGTGRDTKTHSISKSVLTDWVLLAETSETIQHNSDGKKTFKIEGSVSAPSGTGYAGLTTRKTSDSLSLDTIARASSISLSKSTITLSMEATENMFTTITINSASSSFKHTLSYSVGTSGTQSLTITDEKTATIFGYTNIFAPFMPNQTQATCTITCTTYNGSISTSNKIGTSTAKLTIKIPDNIKPSIYDTSNIYISDGAYQPTTSSITEPTDDASAREYCVSGFSKCTIDARFSSGYGSTLTSCQITGPGLPKNNIVNISYPSGGGHSSGTATVQTDVLTASGVLTYTVKVTDSRGRTATKTLYIYCHAYNPPTITISADRLSDVQTQIKVNYSLNHSIISNKVAVGALPTTGDPDMTYIMVTSQGYVYYQWIDDGWQIVSDLDNEDVNPLSSLIIDYRQPTETWGRHHYSVQDIYEKGSLVFTGGGIGFDTSSVYEFRASVLDSVLSFFGYEESSILSQVVEVGTIFRLFNANLDKNAIALGHIAFTPNTFECDLNASFTGSMNIGNSLEMGGEQAIYKDPSTNQTIIYGNEVILGATGQSYINLAGSVGVTGGLTLDGHSTPVGSVLQAAYETVEVASGTHTHLTSVTLPAGSWIITGSLYQPGISGTPSGICRVTLSTTQADDTYRVPNSDTSTLGGTIDSALSGNSYAHNIEVVLINKITSSTTFYLTGFQNSGSKLSLKGAIRAMRIA